MPTIPMTSREALDIAVTFPVLAPYVLEVIEAERFDRIAEKFPSLASARFVTPIHRFDALVAQLGGRAAKHAAAFVLHLFDDELEWNVGRFELRKALGAWDAEQREAFARWAAGVRP